MKTRHILLSLTLIAIAGLFILDINTDKPVYVFSFTDQIGYVSTDYDYDTSKIDGIDRGFDIVIHEHEEGLLMEFIAPVAVSHIHYELDYDVHPNIEWTTEDGIHWYAIIVEETSWDIQDSEFQIFTVSL